MPSTSRSNPAGELPESWQPKATVVPNPVSLPVVDTTDPAQLAAFYSGHGSSFYDQWRKVLLANLREILRAQHTMNNEKVSETRLDDESRVHPIHLEFMREHLEGRAIWEAEAAKQGRGG